MTAEDHMRLQDDGNPHSGEHVRVIRFGERSLPQVGPVVLIVREQHTDWSRVTVPRGMKSSAED